MEKLALNIIKNDLENFKNKRFEKIYKKYQEKKEEIYKKFKNTFSDGELLEVNKED